MRARWSGKTPSKAEFSFHRIELRHHHRRLALPPPSPPPSPSFLCMSLKRIEKQRPCRADRNRPQSPLPSLLNCFLPLLPPLPLTTSPSAELRRLSSRSLFPSTHRARSPAPIPVLKVFKCKERRKAASLDLAGMLAGTGADTPGRPPFVPRCCIASRHRRFTARLQTLASLDPPLPLAEPPPSSLKRKPGFKFHSQRVCSRKEAGIG